MKYLTNADNPAGNGWYDDAEADVLLEHSHGWEVGKAPKSDPDPTKNAPPHPDGFGAPPVPADPDGQVDASGRPTEQPAPRGRRRPTPPSSTGAGNPDGGDADKED